MKISPGWLLSFFLLYFSSHLAALSKPKMTATSRNFQVGAEDLETALQVANYAEHYRALLAQRWTGLPLPERKINVIPGPATLGFCHLEYSSNAEESTGYSLVQGPRAELLESALPHEILHFVLWSFFKQGLPRWGEEGLAVMAEKVRKSAI
jgi:hypothetical protein